VIATVVNALAILGGSLIGLLAGGIIPSRIHDTVMKGLSLCVLMIGLLGIVHVGPTLSSTHVLVIIFSMALGAMIGEAIDIDCRLQWMGKSIENKLNGRGGQFSEGFVTASIVYCVGAMAIVGSLQSGLSGNHETLFAKSVLDGISAIVFTSTFGIGVLFSAVPVFLYQGSITLCAGLLKNVLTTTTINDMTAAGSLLIMAIGFNLIGATKIKVANLLPGLFIPILCQIILNLTGW